MAFLTLGAKRWGYDAASISSPAPVRINSSLINSDAQS